MVETIRQQNLTARALPLVVTALVLAGAFYLGGRASMLWLGLLAGAIGAALFLRQPLYGLFGLVAAALLMPWPIGTGTEVFLVHHQIVC